jgi:Cu2+-exporting ATPase
MLWLLIEMRSWLVLHELELLVQLMPADAHLVQADKIQEVATVSLKIDDVIVIKPGEK